MCQQLPKTLLEAVRVFSDPDTCHRFMVSVKWPDGKVTCPKCGTENVGEIKTRRMFQCKMKGCRKQFSTKVGTIFEDSAIGLDKWLVAVWCITNAKNGISSYELARAMGVTQRTGWFMLHRIRESMNDHDGTLLEGVVESDETFVGGLAGNMHKEVRERKIKKRGGQSGNKTIVHGMLQRGDEDNPSKIRVGIVPNQRRHHMHAALEANIKTGITLYTDELKSYRGLDWKYVHGRVDHAIRWVDGAVHTNGLENFWCLLKRMLGGTYVQVAPKHLIRYCAEEAFRFNKRKGTDGTRFTQVMSSVPGKRLTYKALTETKEPTVGEAV
jgi:transposase-like protein